MGSDGGAEEIQAVAKGESSSSQSSAAAGGNGNQNGLESIVIVHNVAKRHNVGTLARSATAFGAAEMVLVGRRDYNCFGSHGAACHLRFRHFPSLAQAREYLKEQRGADFCGVEIREDAHPLIPQQSTPFRRSTAFLLGNEGTGLSPRECESCDFFVYIPQYGPGTASLNVTVAASIVLHHFAAWACFPERARSGENSLLQTGLLLVHPLQSLCALWLRSAGSRGRPKLTCLNLKTKDRIPRTFYIPSSMIRD
ncbi:tRNA (Guanosine(18)-2'-O)-methyltransferase [Rhynchospora pubera]|uniref:tRNA (Guanosine(18)-2'-O)-methyltransferase n=1 Tax=Rhynchospora pubera TaxID=906938 RepID=A0AAV8GMT5_9POAL|nr:tRNA (Guanosine(18)-2'-O)-methyltransferase [Rhynchospora pubera]